MNQILSTCFTKTAALAALADLEQKVRSRQMSQKDYQDIANEVNAIEPLHLETAIALDSKQAQEIVEKLRKDYGKNFFVEFKTNPSLIGGATLSYKGTFKDYSIKLKVKNEEGKKNYDMVN